MTQLHAKMIAESDGFIGDAISWLRDKVGALFSRTEEVEQRSREVAVPSDPQVSLSPDAQDYLNELAATGQRNARDAVALQGALKTLQDHLDRVGAEWERVVAEAARVKRDIDNINGGIAALTEQFATQYASETANALAVRLDPLTREWDDLTQQAAQLRTVVLELQEQVRVIEDQVKSAEQDLQLERKGWAQLLIDLGQAGLLRPATFGLVGSGIGAAARGAVTLTWSVYQAALNYFNEQEDALTEKLDAAREFLAELESQAIVAPSLQSQVAAARDVVAQLESKIRELRQAENELADDYQREGVSDEYAADKSAKAFWDPQDDEDHAALTERIDSLATRVERAIEDNDEEEQGQLMAELDDLLAGLTDDTRFRVQDLINRLHGDEDFDAVARRHGDKSAPGAHTLYK